MTPSVRAAWMGVSAGLLALALALPASATTVVLKRSFENMPQGVFDALLSPVTAGKSVYDNMTTIEDTPGVRIAYAVPGYVWNTMSNLGGGIIRSLTGVIELPAGLFLLFSDNEMEPLFDPAEDNDGLVQYDEYEDIYRVKFGINYTAGG